MIAHLISSVALHTKRVIVIVHTQEIVLQIQSTIQTLFKLPIGIVMGKYDDVSNRIIVSSLQSLNTRYKRIVTYGTPDFIIIDEAHHATPNNSYGEIIKKISNKTTKIAGFTATPNNNTLFDETVFSWTINDGIKSGYLVPLLEINTKKNPLEAYKTHILPTKRQCIAFFPSILSSQSFSLSLNKLGIHSAHIDGSTPKEERNTILDFYKKGDIKTICNMQVLTEGFDAPNTSAILLARITHSKTLLTQIKGRGLRPSPKKKNCLIVNIKRNPTPLYSHNFHPKNISPCQPHWQPKAPA